jgi:DNA polymerase-3 subunit epsilon
MSTPSRSTNVPTTSSPQADPPPGAPWDLPLSDAPLVFFDLEMTGLDPAREAIVEVAFVREEGGRVVDEFSSLVAPEIPVSAGALAIHGLDAATLAGAPRFETIATRVASLLEGAVPVAHGAVLDVRFLGPALERAGCDPAPLAFVLDTVVLARRAVAAPRYALAELSRALGLPARRWHRAREDVEALRALFPRLVRELAPPSARDLWEVRIGQREVVRVRASIAARLAALAGGRSTATLVVRHARRAPRLLRGFVERWDPPHVYVRPAGSRSGLKVVRADRVLRVEG